MQGTISTSAQEDGYCKNSVTVKSTYKTESTLVHLKYKYIVYRGITVLFYELFFFFAKLKVNIMSS